MNWFLYDNGLRHERVKWFKKKKNKLCVNLGIEFYNKSFKKWLDDNDIKMYSTQFLLSLKHLLETLK